MDLKDFTFDLPERLIAQRPLPKRDDSRLMVLSRKDGTVAHKGFKDLPGFLRPGDLLVLNDTKVMCARLIGQKPTGGRVELLLTEKTGIGREWKCMAKPAKGLKKGTRVLFDGIEAEITGDDGDGFFRCLFNGPLDLGKAGKMPLPPYIRREADEEDSVRYQTVFAGQEGAVAAPTAGLHFTPAIMEEIKGKGVEVRYVTLHTGPGTFMPVRTGRIEDHRMMHERYSIGADTFESVLRAKREGRRVVAVGTTSTRALESSVLNGFDAPVLEGSSGLFIYPGFRFNVVDCLLTNFHLPGSTLIMLVSAFAGLDFTLKAYKEAVEMEYRFFSYGDAMLIQ